ncbi:MAG: hypothetical protein IPP74_06625 [Alphaproteobacteria bacterium]|nr:hypothetical protein [Alphaproteobacteria bacterium]
MSINSVTQTTILPTRTTNSSSAANTASSSTSSDSSKAAQTLAGDFSNFLKLLTVQLQNQDPTQPLDANAFTNQLVSFSGVEQAVKTNKNLESIIQMSQESQINNAVSYLGNVVEVEGSKAELKNGQALFSYDLPSSAKNVFVSISDQNGKVVYTSNGETTAGKHQFVWTGVNQSQQRLPDGSYDITVSALDDKGQPIVPKTTITGQVDSVAIQNDGAVLSIGDLNFSTDKVLSVKAPSYAYLGGQTSAGSDTGADTESTTHSN